MVRLFFNFCPLKIRYSYVLVLLNKGHRTEELELELKASVRPVPPIYDR